ncbi:MAG: YlxR family protein [Nocardioidaceae bacterium]|nr:YlxR family protein [Nocardioidaceae bacterium]
MSRALRLHGRQLRGHGRSTPVRTCVGCRRRASITDLVRVVALGYPTAQVVVPDLRGGAPGRGAHLHPDAGCLDLAERRRAFGRALRVEGPVDTDLVRRLVQARSGTAHEPRHDGHPTST